MSAKCFMSNLTSSHAAPASQPLEIGHVKQHTQFSVLPDESLELGHKVLIIRLYKPPAEVKDEHLPAVFFIHLNGHFGFL